MTVSILGREWFQRTTLDVGRSSVKRIVPESVTR